MTISLSSWANIDEEFLNLAKLANVKVISFGIESVNEEVLLFYKKNIGLQSAKKLVQYANNIGIYTVGNFIIGAPMETPETIKETFMFIRDCGFDKINIKTLNYMQGSELYMTLPLELQNTTFLFACKENGLNSFSLQELTRIKNDFVKTYNEERRKTLKQKIKKYGTPYELDF